MNNFNITLNAGEAIQLKTAGKYCGNDITIAATGVDPSIPFVVNSLVDPTAAFEFSNVKSITVGAVDSIAAGTFKSYTNLESITLPFIGTNAAASGGDSESGYFRTIFEQYSSSAIPSTLKEINITGKTNIVNWAFEGCSMVESINIGYGATSIDQGAFSSCTSLTSVTLPESITSISTIAFQYNTQSFTINVPWAEGTVAGAPWGAVAATINYNYRGE